MCMLSPRSAGLASANTHLSARSLTPLAARSSENAMPRRTTHAAPAILHWREKKKHHLVWLRQAVNTKGTTQT
jgi:hypothetical protein